MGLKLDNKKKTIFVYFTRGYLYVEHNLQNK